MRRDERPLRSPEAAAAGGAGSSLLRRAAPLLLAAASALSSCGDWVSVGPFVRCGGACEAPEGLQCGEFGSQYNSKGRCVCAEDARCANYPCELPAESKCFIAGYDADETCVCVSKLKPGTCGQPCAPFDILAGCVGQKYEYNEDGDCACGPAACPCGQVCPGSPEAGCLLLRQYDAKGNCACAPVQCPSCEEKPCCSELCGTECTIPGCVDDGSGSCEGFCSKTSECVQGSQSCSEVP
jgi:hypothetical protein